MFVSKKRLLQKSNLMLMRSLEAPQTSIKYVIAILYHKGYDMERMLSQTRRLCLCRAERYGPHSAMLMCSIEGKLHAVLDDCSDPSHYMTLALPLQHITLQALALHFTTMASAQCCCLNCHVNACNVCCDIFHWHILPLQHQLVQWWLAKKLHGQHLGPVQLGLDPTESISPSLRLMTAGGSIYNRYTPC